MEMQNVSLRGVKVDPLAHELATSEGTRPYLDCLIREYRNNGARLEAALQVVRDLPLEKRYTVESVFCAEVGIRRLRGRVRSTRSSPHPRTHTVGDDQGTRTAPPTVADVVAGVPH